jgi:hypothetical protein
MTDHEFAALLEGCTLPRSDFNHAAHVRLAWIYLQRLPFDEAVARTCATIRRYATHLGAQAKFHCTVTAALMALLRAGGATDTALAWEDFLQRNAALLADARAALARHYSSALLESDAARGRFVAPDLAPLP